MESTLYYNVKYLKDYKNYYCLYTSFRKFDSRLSFYFYKPFLSEHVDLNEFSNPIIHEKTKMKISFSLEENENIINMFKIDKENNSGNRILKLNDRLIFNFVLKSCKPEEDYRDFFKYTSLLANNNNNVVNGVYIRKSEMRNKIKRILFNIKLIKTKTVPTKDLEQGQLF